MKLINIRRMLYLMPLMILSGCEETNPQQQDTVSFYVQAKPQAKAIVEDTGSLIYMNLPLYVTEDGTGTSFTATELQHTSNGVWRSSINWEPRQYNFYAYIKSSTNLYDKGILSITNNGRSVTVTQPSNYSANPEYYADYLLSYRVSADGKNKPLVQFEMERITTSVELYMTAAPNMSSVRLKKAEFQNIFRSAQYNIIYHAASTDPDVNGLKNTWAVNVDQSQKTTYTLNHSNNPIELKKFDEAKGRFASEYKIMSFLTVQQSLLDNQNALLNLTYEVEENGKPVEYEASFDLGKYDVKSWAVGHKIRYYVSVDTSVELQGSIEPWKTVESIEGTFLPK